MNSIHSIVLGYDGLCVKIVQLNFSLSAADIVNVYRPQLEWIFSHDFPGGPHGFDGRGAVSDWTDSVELGFLVTQDPLDVGSGLAAGKAKENYGKDSGVVKGKYCPQDQEKLDSFNNPEL